MTADLVCLANYPNQPFLRSFERTDFLPKNPDKLIFHFKRKISYTFLRKRLMRVWKNHAFQTKIAFYNYQKKQFFKQTNFLYLSEKLIPCN